MALHKGTSTFTSLGSVENEDSWKFNWPNTADFNFNYYKLLDDAANTGIAKNNRPKMRIAIVGAGVAGLTAARELFRSGYTNIHIYEASNRIGGRTRSEKVPKQHTVFEMGAMRMPYFAEPGSRNSVLDYYTTRYKITTQPFPNPGSSIPKATGIFMNNGYGPSPNPSNPPAPHMDIWPGDQKEPPNESFRVIYKKWETFADFVTKKAQRYYGTDNWFDFWNNLVKHYWQLNFRELAYFHALPECDWSEDEPGYFGGLGMTEEEATLFYTIGAGDGSWGAFYDICCLFPIRTLLFGYGTDHRLIQGKFNDQGEFAGGPQNAAVCHDSLGNPIPSPNYLGVQSFAECMLYEPVKSQNVPEISLYEAISHPDYDVRLMTQTPVKALHSVKPQVYLSSDSCSGYYDAVVLTTPTWAMQLGIDFHNFDIENQMPIEVQHSLKSSHWITSAKIFYPLKERYWEKSKIPQIISTDTYLQGVYGYALETNSIKDPGALLVSYTWEDDANKFLAAQDEQALAQKALDKLDQILMRSENIQMPISQFVDTTKAYNIHWMKEPSYHGCAKLYRETTWNQNYALLRYNEKNSEYSGLYMAGEAFSVEGGWTEPALRGALEAVLYICKNSGAEFLNDFEMSLYPKHNTYEPEVSHQIGIEEEVQPQSSVEQHKGRRRRKTGSKK